jgi:hypothetical protein
MSFVAILQNFISGDKTAQYCRPVSAIRSGNHDTIFTPQVTKLPEFWF